MISLPIRWLYFVSLPVDFIIPPKLPVPFVLGVLTSPFAVSRNCHVAYARVQSLRSPQPEHLALWPQGRSVIDTWGPPRRPRQRIPFLDLLDRSNQFAKHTIFLYSEQPGPKWRRSSRGSLWQNTRQMHSPCNPLSASRRGPRATDHGPLVAVAAFFFFALAFFLLLSRGFSSVIPALHVSA